MKTLVLTVGVTADCHFTLEGHEIDGSALLDALYEQGKTGKAMPLEALRTLRAIVQVLTMMRKPGELLSY